MEKNLTAIAYRERSEQVLEFVKYSSSVYIAPLYLLFSVADYLWYNPFFVEFFLIRLACALLTIFYGKITLKYLSTKLNADVIGLFTIVICALPLHYMLIRINDPSSPYYAGLLLVLVGLCIGLRLSWLFHFVSIFVILAPFVTYFAFNSEPLTLIKSYFLLNLTFFISVTMIGSVGKFVYEGLIQKEFSTRQQLNNELDNRATIIDQKTAENIKLSELSRQFSPQIIESIRKGEIHLKSSIHETNVAVIFIDIIDSTKKVISLNKDSVQTIVSNFMDDVMSTFLMFDVTIDKFLGDGFMGFTNDPLPRKDFLERALLASDSIINKIESKSAFYSHYWNGPFKIRVSIACGPAAIGFYGNEKLIKTYTALGRPVILASRMNGVAAPNCITVSKEVIDHLQVSNINFFQRLECVSLGVQKLKGFEKEEIETYSIRILDEPTAFIQAESCPHGHGPLVLESNNLGIYELRCRTCSYVLSEDGSSTPGSKAS